MSGTKKTNIADNYVCTILIQILIQQVNDNQPTNQPINPPLEATSTNQAI